MKRMAYVIALVAAMAGPALAQQGGHGGMQGHEQMQGMDHAGMDDHGMGSMLTSIPADGAVLDEAPRTIALNFMHPVTLQTVAITGPDGAPVRATFRRPSAPTADYSIALPALASGAYQAQWTASGMGHDMTGALTFTVR